MGRIALSCAFVLLLLLLAALAASVPEPPGAYFQTAKAIWPEKRETEMNLTVGFRAVFDSPAGHNAVLRVTASSLYRAWLNGKFLGHGPARGPHGYYRVDEWNLAGRLQPGRNIVAIEVAGYNVNSYYLLDQPSFLLAEVVAGSKVLASTSGEGSKFAARILEERVQKVERYSTQRTFTEAYRLRPGYDRWRSDPEFQGEPARYAVQGEKKLLPRRVPYPDFALRGPLVLVSEGSVHMSAKPEKPWRSRALQATGSDLKGYAEPDLEWVPSFEVQKIATSAGRRLDQALHQPASLPLPTDSYKIFDFGTNLTGFPGALVTCASNARLYFVFDELLTNDDVNFRRLSAINIVAYELAPGRYEVESIEPYTFRYLKLIATGGDCEAERVYLREYANSNVYQARFASSDRRLNRLFDAGRETFRQNALDIFMDCPSRERAGWLCDSFFMARVEPNLSGDTVIEKNFFENYLLPERYPHIPNGMLPMCYPADHYGGRFIPNWAMWFVLQLAEYLERSGDRRMVDALEPKVLKLFEYFEKFRNEDGLLESLDSWVFIEWSAANRFTQDVNYPTNMLYAGALEAAAGLYNNPAFLAEARRVRDAVRRQSFDGQFFVDNAVRNNGRLEATRNRTEVCQYFAFYFDVATPETHQNLWIALRDRFGPRREKTGHYPEVHPANAFIGNKLRLELLSRYGRTRQLLDESVSYLLYMAERTGTLWEMVGPTASCNHGFASHIVHVLYRDVLGLYQVNPAEKAVKLRFSDLDLDWAEGEVPVPGGRVSMRWRREGGKILYRVDAPASYRIHVENQSGATLVFEP